MGLIEERKEFEKNKKIYESVKLKFHGVEGYDVYNSSIPFQWKGQQYIYGRVERRQEWARSWVRLFKNTGKDVWTLVPDTMIYQLEDPYISIINDNLVLGGTHVRFNKSKIDTYYGYFYKGTEINDLVYFTTGPDHMKDIRLVKIDDQNIGVFSRPRNEEVHKKYGSGSVIGFTIIKDLDELDADTIENAPVINKVFDKDEWGGCNQCYYLDSGLIGVIGHKCYKADNILTYMNMSFVFDPKTYEVMDMKIIGTRSCYPDGPSKKINLVDCAFTSGIVMRDDGKADLYSGIGDCEVGRIVIDYPFENYGKII